MSNIPTPKEIPPTPQQIDRTLQSVIGAAQTLIATDTRHFANLWASFLAMYTHPTFQLILGIPTQVNNNPPTPTNASNSELQAIKRSIEALTKSVADLQPKVKAAKAPDTQTPHPASKPVAQGKGHAMSPNPTYASTAALPPRPSLVIELGATDPENHASIPVINRRLNEYMQEIGRDEIKFSAARYNKKGNLVLTAHHKNSQTQLNSVADNITKLITQITDESGLPANLPIKARPNVKRSKLLIHSVPVWPTLDRGPFTPKECHCSLVMHNPTYAALKITQKPSWVRQPNTLKDTNCLSLVIAFEDPSRQEKRSILSNKQLYLLGARAKVARWKEKPKPSKNPNNKVNPGVQEAQDDDNTDHSTPATPCRDEDAEAPLTPPIAARPPSQQTPTPSQPRTHARASQRKG